MSKNVLLVGSLPIASTAEAFLVITNELDGFVVCMPGGEAGERVNWVEWWSSFLSPVPFRDDRHYGPKYSVLSNPDSCVPNFIVELRVSRHRLLSAI